MSNPPKKKTCVSDTKQMVHNFYASDFILSKIVEANSESLLLALYRKEFGVTFRVVVQCYNNDIKTSNGQHDFLNVLSHCVLDRFSPNYSGV